MTAVEKIIAEINNELQTLESLHGKEIFGRKVGLAFAKRVAEQAKEMEKEQMIKFAKHCLDKSIDLDILMAYNQVEIEYTNQTFKSE